MLNDLDVTNIPLLAPCVQVRAEQPLDHESRVEQLPSRGILRKRELDELKVRK